jgi:hypothetical protein
MDVGIHIGLLLADERDEALAASALQGIAEEIVSIHDSQGPISQWTLLLVDTRVISSGSQRFIDQTEVPIIALVDDANDSSRSQFDGRAVWGYLPLPLSAERLRPAVQLALEGFARQRSLRQEIHHLKASLEDRKQIERARGLVMKQSGVTAAEADARLQRLAIEHSVSVAHIARMILIAQELLSPESPTQRASGSLS